MCKLELDWSYNSGSAKVVAIGDNTASIQKKHVATTTLDNYMENFIGEKVIKLAKIDVEGHEHLVLKGINRSNADQLKNIILEFKENEANNQLLFNEIERLGYQVKNIYGNSLELNEKALKDLPECNLWLSRA
jgi:hypothetical protein